MTAYPPVVPPDRDDETPLPVVHAADHNSLSHAIARLVEVLGTDELDGTPGRLSVDGIADAIIDAGGGPGGGAYDDTAVRALITQEATTRAAGDTTLADGLAGKASTAHMHTAAQVSDFAEAAQDAVAAMLASGANVTLSYNDAGNVLTVTAAGPDAELMRDTIGTALVGVGNVTVTVNDPGDTITISTTATVNATDAALRDRSTHTGSQSLDTTTDTATRVAMTPAERTKLTGVATGATANATDAQLRDRSTHTGSQLISATTGLQAALDGKQPALPTPTPDGKLLGVAAGAYALVDPPAGGGGGGTDFTGTGSPEGAQTATVGQTYRDTNASNGAVLWVKATGSGNTGWRVVYGDTGWRVLTNPGTITSGGPAIIKRVNERVYVRVKFFAPTSSDQTWTLGTGFLPGTPATGMGEELWIQQGLWIPGGRFKITTSGNLILRNGGETTQGIATAQWTTDDAWPTTLPGTAA